MSSNVGSSAVYEAGDQRNYSNEEKKEQAADKFEEGKENSHKADDPKDERSIANRLEKETKSDEDNDDTLEVQQLKEDPTLPARSHGNEPSKGAKIDAQLQNEEEEEIRKKDEAKAQAAAAKKNHGH